MPVICNAYVAELVLWSDGRAKIFRVGTASKNAITRFNLNNCSIVDYYQMQERGSIING